MSKSEYELFDMLYGSRGGTPVDMVCVVLIAIIGGSYAVVASRGTRAPALWAIGLYIILGYVLIALIQHVITVAQNPIYDAAKAASNTSTPRPAPSSSDSPIKKAANQLTINTIFMSLKTLLLLGSIACYTIGLQMMGGGGGSKRSAARDRDDRDDDPPPPPRKNVRRGDDDY